MSEVQRKGLELYYSAWPQIYEPASTSQKDKEGGSVNTRKIIPKQAEA